LYAEFKMGDFSKVVMHEDRLTAPLHWKRSRLIFINSLSDMFHRDVSVTFLREMFQTMALTQDHIYIGLTKRLERARAIMGDLNGDIAEPGARPAIGEWPPRNFWLGASIEDSKFIHRADILASIHVHRRILSIEPIIGPVDLRNYLHLCDTALFEKDGQYSKEIADESLLTKAYAAQSAWAFHWVIVGGETGYQARPSHPAWYRMLRDQCAYTGVPFFVKQIGEWSWEPASPNMPADGYLDEAGRHTLFQTAQPGCIPVYRRGRWHTGAALDGMLWRQFPPIERPQASLL
jgi:protein gp37